jgi:hypothetical protein
MAARKKFTRSSPSRLGLEAGTFAVPREPVVTDISPLSAKVVMVGSVSGKALDHVIARLTVFHHSRDFDISNLLMAGARSQAERQS